MAKNFTWHSVTEEEKKDIREEAKNLLQEFASKLDKIKTQTSQTKNTKDTREEGAGWETDQTFKEIMFANAPFVEDNAIVAEKGAWKKK